MALHDPTPAGAVSSGQAINTTARAAATATILTATVLTATASGSASYHSAMPAITVTTTSLFIPLNPDGVNHAAPTFDAW